MWSSSFPLIHYVLNLYLLCVFHSFCFLPHLYFMLIAYVLIPFPFLSCQPPLPLSSTYTFLFRLLSHLLSITSLHLLPLLFILSPLFERVTTSFLLLRYCNMQMRF